MSTIILFHSALGLRPAIHQFADALRSDGHIVHTPDLFDGEVFDTLDEGVAKRDALGIPELINRAYAAVAELPSDVFYAGFSMGGASAELLAATRPGAKGCILMYAALPLELMRIETWPAAVPVQFHASVEDVWVDADVVAKLETQIADFDAHWYEGDQHLFADAGSEDYIAHHAEAMLGFVRKFVT